MTILTDARVEAAVRRVSSALDAANNSNHTGEVAVVAMAEWASTLDALKQTTGMLRDAMRDTGWSEAEDTVDDALAVIRRAEGRGG